MISKTNKKDEMEHKQISTNSELAPPSHRSLYSFWRINCKPSSQVAPPNTPPQYTQPLPSPNSTLPSIPPFFLLTNLNKPNQTTQFPTFWAYAPFSVLLGSRMRYSPRRACCNSLSTSKRLVSAGTPNCEREKVLFNFPGNRMKEKEKNRDQTTIHRQDDELLSAVWS